VTETSDVTEISDVMERPPEWIDGGDFVLRRARSADAELIATTVATNLGRLSAWMGWAVPSAGTVDEQRRRLRETMAQWARGTSFQYLAIHAGTETHLGNFALERRIGPRAIELGYWLAEDATGYGYATAAAQMLTDAALALSDVDRVEIHCDTANLRSQAIPRRLGYRLDRIEVDGISAPAESGHSMIWVYPG
jgi:RimJ/RimL family protein N-acetyltransferase